MHYLLPRHMKDIMITCEKDLTDGFYEEKLNTLPKETHEKNTH